MPTGRCVFLLDSFPANSALSQLEKSSGLRQETTVPPAYPTHPNSSYLVFTPPSAEITKSTYPDPRISKDTDEMSHGSACCRPRPPFLHLCRWPQLMCIPSFPYFQSLVKSAHFFNASNPETLLNRPDIEHTCARVQKHCVQVSLNFSYNVSISRIVYLGTTNPTCSLLLSLTCTRFLQIPFVLLSQ